MLPSLMLCEISSNYVGRCLFCKELEVAQLVRAPAFQHKSVVRVVGLNPAAVH